MEKIQVSSITTGTTRTILCDEDKTETTSLSDRTSRKFMGTGLKRYTFDDGTPATKIDDDTFEDRSSGEQYRRIK